MIKMGEITCRIPSNGIKSEVLYCTEPEGMRLGIWSTTSDVIVALFTAILCAVAIFALIVAKRTLNQMQDDSEAQWDAVRIQMDEQAEISRQAAAANKQLAREQMQTQALVNFVGAIRDIKVNAIHPEYNIEVGTSHVSITWLAWSMFLHDEYESLLKLTQDATGDLSKLTAFIRDANKKVQAGVVPAEDLVDIMEAYDIFIGRFIANLCAWQTADTKRELHEKSIRDNFVSLRDLFPTVLGGVPVA